VSAIGVKLVGSQNLDKRQEGLAESIANEDGERQIACAVAFHGEEIVSLPFFLDYEMNW
jgi:hypothetical protein